MLRTPEISGERVIVADGARLGLKVWPAPRAAAVIIAVHGMNDYSRAYAQPAAYWAERGVTTYAYDQRGFGRSPATGRWPGEGALVQDLRSVIAAARREHPDSPVFIIGHSMGAAVILAAMEEAPLNVDGVILASPGVWGGGQLAFPWRAALNIAASLAPAKTLSGARAGRQSTDNIEILREMSKDPLIIKETRLDALLGVVRLMGRAWRATDDVGGDILFLYGLKDEIIPVDAMQSAAARLCGEVDAVAYPEGWHLLLRDLQAERVWSDILSWIERDAENPARAEAGPAALACPPPQELARVEAVPNSTSPRLFAPRLLR